MKWTISRGRDTYGYNICSLYVGNKKVTSCKGGGYDMKGTALGDWIAQEFQEVLKDSDLTGYYGHYKNDETGAITLDGGCGWNCMVRILEEVCKFALDWAGDTRNHDFYICRERDGE